MQIGNTQTPVKFNTDVDSYMEKWFQESPTHHFAMSVGHNASLFKKTADILGINAVVI
jgi:L-arabinose isomerase